MTLRTFIAVDIGPLEELVVFKQNLESIGASLKLVEPENIHLTLKFLGDTSEEFIDNITEIIRECASEIKPFKLEFKGAGAFPNLNYMKVLWVGVNDQGVLAPLAIELNSKLTELGFKPEKRGFKPHITLGRVKSPKKKKELKKLLIENKDKFFCELDIDNIRLKKSVLDSKGPTYYTLSEVKLG